MKCYEFRIKLKNAQYVFLLNGKKPFWFGITEPSGHKLPIFGSNNEKLIMLENIYDYGTYIITVYTYEPNFVEMIWGIYSDE